MTTRRRSKESRVGIALTWLATIGGLMLVAGSLLLGQYAWGNAMEGVQTSGWFTCRDEACVRQGWLRWYSQPYPRSWAWARCCACEPEQVVITLARPQLDRPGPAYIAHHRP